MNFATTQFPYFRNGPMFAPSQIIDVEVRVPKTPSNSSA